MEFIALSYSSEILFVKFPRFPALLAVSLITEARLPENHNVAYDVTNTASKSSFSLSYAVLDWFGCRNNMHRFGLIVSCGTVQNFFNVAFIS